MPKVLVPFADGFEEIEALTIVDILRRAGVEVVTASLNEQQQAQGAHQVTVLTDATLDAVLLEAFDMIVLPGGLPGAFNLRDDARIITLLQAMNQAGKWTAAICAAPVALAKAGLLQQKTATGYPGALESMNLTEVTLSDEKVVQDGTVITSRGPATAMVFALHLVENLVGAEKRAELESGLLHVV